MLFNYSPMEMKILEAIPANGRKISTLDLVYAVYGNKNQPLTARQSVVDAAKKLIRKVDLNEEPYELFRSVPRGPHPIYFWREPRRAKTVTKDFFTERISDRP